MDAARVPEVVRKANAPAELQFNLIPYDTNFVVPTSGARVTFGRSNGQDVFAGYVVETPKFSLLGWTERGPVYKYEVLARSDEMVLDMKTAPSIPPFVGRSASEALQQLTEDTWSDWADFAAIQKAETLPYYRVGPAKRWSETAKELAVLGRSAYRSEGNKLILAPVAQKTYALNEIDAKFSPHDFTLHSKGRLLNDVTVLGLLEPSAHVKDYFVGDGFTTRFYLSQIPFSRGNQIQSGVRTILDEEYTELDPKRWVETDPAGVLGVSGGKLQVSGGTGHDGETRLQFVEKIELGGAVVLQHGDVVFNTGSDGVIGGLYGGAVTVAGCLAGFRITNAGASSRIQALINGAATGPAITTQANHRYVMTTRVFANELYRMNQVFHSSTHPAGSARGGNAITSDARVVLEVHDIDPGNPGTQAQAAMVLYDGVVPNTPGFCRYALINATRMQCSLTFTRVTMPVDALVRSTLPGEAARTRRAGSLLEGADCRVSEDPALQFYPQYTPAANELIEVHYRGRGRARARVMDPASVVAHRHGNDNGVRGGLMQISIPAPRTSVDCETAALAQLDDAGQGWSGEYKVWSQFLPGDADDIFPGDGLQLNMPSRMVAGLAIVDEVRISVVDMAGENSVYTLSFVDAGDSALGYVFERVGSQPLTTLPALDKSVIGSYYLPDLTATNVTAVTSTSITIDAGFAPTSGQGIEVRSSDAGWGPGNDRNLIGRFTKRSFTVARFGRVQTYFLRRYDSSVPVKYSRFSATLHVDYPL